MDRPIEVTIDVNAAHGLGPCRPIWNWFGYDEPNYTYGADGRKLLRELAALTDTPPRIRTHNLLTSGDGKPALKWGSTNAYSEDAAGSPVYDWTVTDRIFDAWVEAGVVPFVQIGFMPEALSDDPGPYRHDWSLDSPYRAITTGWAVPPNDLGKWHDLVAAWAAHLVDRYGRETVATWPWEIWNEPDGHYWKGTVAEFCDMYDAAVAAIRKVLPEARIGGPHTCGPSESPQARDFLRAFLRHVVETGAPLDFIAFHAKGRPEVVDGHVRMGLAKQLRDIETGLAIVAEFPELAGLPVILGESDPEGCAACSARVHPQNAYRNGPLYGAYVVESMMRTVELSRRAGNRIEGAVTWAFAFEHQPYFDGFRDLATNGIGKAVLNAFRLLGKLGGTWIAATSSHGLPLDDVLARGIGDAPDVNAVATRDDTGTTVLAWNYHDDDLPAEGAARATVRLADLPEGTVRLEEFRMDGSHGNAFAAWQAMGAPQQPDPAAQAELEAAGRLPRTSERTLNTEGGRASFEVDLPRQGVVACRLEWG